MTRLTTFTSIAFTVSIFLATGSAGATRNPRWFQPLLSLPHADLVRAECVISRESVSTLAHPNLGDDNGNVPGDSGIFQIDNSPRGIWDTYVLPKLHVKVWKASAYQQAEGFVIIWHVDGFGPWHRYDGC